MQPMETSTKCCLKKCTALYQMEIHVTIHDEYLMISFKLDMLFLTTSSKANSFKTKSKSCCVLLVQDVSPMQNVKLFLIVYRQSIQTYCFDLIDMLQQISNAVCTNSTFIEVNAKLMMPHVVFQHLRPS